MRINKFVVISTLVIFLLSLAIFAYAEKDGYNIEINNKNNVRIAENLGGNNSDDRQNNETEDNNYNDDNKTSDNENETEKEFNRGIGQRLKEEIKEKKEEYKGGNYTGPLVKFLNVRELSEDLRELRSGNVSANTDLNLTEETQNGKTKIKVHLNKEDVELMVMPDTAAQIAIEKLKLKACSKENNCTIMLRKMEIKNKEEADYEVKVEKKAKIMGLINTKMQVEASINAQTGEIITINKPWWAFLASESEE